MLRMEGVSQRFGTTYALEDVSFDVEAGEVHALLGENGAGKSTLMKVLAGNYPEASGTIAINDRTVVCSSPTAALAEGIGVVYQEFDLVPEFTVAENIFLGHESKGGTGGGVLRVLSRGALTRRADELIHRYGLQEFVSGADRVRELPIASQQLVEILRVLSTDPSVIVFDEPSARLSGSEREVLFTIIDELRRDRRAVVYVSHHLEEVFRLAQRITVLRNGRRVATALPAELDEEKLSSLMLGRSRGSAEPAAPVRSRETVSSPPPGDGRRRAGLGVESLSVAGAIHGASLHVAPGELIGVTGNLGSGRRELVRAVVGVVPSAGRVTISSDHSESRPTLGAEMGFVPEDRRREGLCLERSVRDNIALGFLASCRRGPFVSRKLVDARCHELVTTVKLKFDSLDQPVWQLSGGNQQKVLLARWLGSDAQIIVLESPTVGVDVGAKAEIHHLVSLLKEQGRTIVVSSDDIAELEVLCDRIVLVDRGVVAKLWNREEFTHASLVGALMGKHAAGATDRAHQEVASVPSPEGRGS